MEMTAIAPAAVTSVRAPSERLVALGDFALQQKSKKASRTFKLLCNFFLKENNLALSI